MLANWLTSWLAWLARPADAAIVALLVGVTLVALAGRLARPGL